MASTASGGAFASRIPSIINQLTSLVYRGASALLSGALEIANMGRDLAAIRLLRHLVGDFSHDTVEVGDGAAHLTSNPGTAAAPVPKICKFCAKGGLPGRRATLCA